MQAEDAIAEAFAKIGDQEQAREHCEASIMVVTSIIAQISNSFTEKYNGRNVL